MSERVWLVTGASSGFGRSLADAVLDRGDIVVAAVRRPDSLGNLWRGAGGRLGVLELDVADTDRIPAAVEEVASSHGRIDVLVNNAGRGLVGAAEESSDSELRDLMELHFFGPAALTRAVLPGMRERGSGAIVQMSSMGGRLSFPGVGAYSASKFALEGWSEALAAEVRPFGIRVMIVEPGAFRTGFNRPAALATSRPIDAYRDTVGAVGRTLQETDGRQPGDPERAAGAIVGAIEAAEPPLRLALGSDSVAAIAAHLEDESRELDAWAAVGRATDFTEPRNARAVEGDRGN